MPRFSMHRTIRILIHPCNRAGKKDRACGGPLAGQSKGQNIACSRVPLSRAVPRLPGLWSATHGTFGAGERLIPLHITARLTPVA
jgi:hypothetical protein